METKKNNHLHSKTGFTLIEMLMALAISSIVMGAIYSVFTITNKNFTTQNVASGVQQSLRSAIGMMSRDIRLAGLDPIGTDNFGIKYASPDEIRFTQDSIDSGTGVFNGVVDEANFEDIMYKFDFDATSGQIKQTLYKDKSSENSAVLIGNIEAPSFFSYLDAANNDLIDPVLGRVPDDKLTEIRSVEITITIQEPAGRDEPVSRTLVRKVECRNLAFN